MCKTLSGFKKKLINRRHKINTKVRQHSVENDIYPFDSSFVSLFVSQLINNYNNSNNEDDKRLGLGLLKYLYLNAKQ